MAIPEIYTRIFLLESQAKATTKVMSISHLKWHACCDVDRKENKLTSPAMTAKHMLNGSSVIAEQVVA